MKQIAITQYGNTDVLKIQDKSDPIPSSGEVLVNVKAIGINFISFQGFWTYQTEKA